MLYNPTGVRQGAAFVQCTISKDPQLMCGFLHKGCRATTTFLNSTVRTTLAPMRCTSQSIHECVAKWDSYFAHLASMVASMYEGLLVRMFTESFSDCWKSPYGGGLSGLLKKGGSDLTDAQVQIGAGVYVPECVEVPALSIYAEVVCSFSFE